MRFIDIRELTIPLSRYPAASALPAALTTSIVAITTDVIRNGRPIIGYGFSSIGRYAQGGLIRERFAPRLLAASPASLVSTHGKLDPTACWSVMMAGEKAGGHGERCVAVGTLDMAIWDAAAKIADVPLCVFLSEIVGRREPPARVPVYASGGYPYPDRDVELLNEELQQFVDLGFTRAKMKIGTLGLPEDLRRVARAAALLEGKGVLAVDAMNAYETHDLSEIVRRLGDYGLWWLEDLCDPHEFAAQAHASAESRCAIAAGEALFSLPEAKLLDLYGGLDRNRDILVFDPIHCYGLTGYLRIVDFLLDKGWHRRSFWPHGGSMFCQHIAAALGLGGAEVNPLAFAPFCGLAAGQDLVAGSVSVPEIPGIGFERHNAVWEVMRGLAVA